MEELKTSQPKVRWLSCASILMAVLGGAFYWWVPMGMVLSLGGLVLGFVDWTAALRRSLDYRLAIVGMILCAIVLAFDGIIYYLGMQIFTFGGQ